MGSAKRPVGQPSGGGSAGIAVPRLVNVVCDGKAVPAACASCWQKDSASCDLTPADALSELPFDRDEYDDKFAEYLAVRDPLTNRRMGSLRLLQTDRPHILGSVFPDLCERPAPSGPAIREVTQLCLSPALDLRERRLVSRQLATALVEYGLLTGITTYTTVMELIWSRQLTSMGWDCEPLGLGRPVGDTLLGAFQVHIDASTVGGLRAAGCYVPGKLEIVERDDQAMLFDTLAA